VTEVHGQERVEGVTIAQVDKDWNPIAGTKRRLKCDTLLISAGLIPENELSKMAGIELDPITGGPVVDEHMETSVSGFFTAGNVVHVNDLVDNVSWEGEIAGSSAAAFAMGKAMPQKSKISLKAGENVRYLIPQHVAFGEEVTLCLRVKEPAEKVRLSVGEMATKGLRAVKPSEMVKLSISCEQWEKVRGDISEIVVSCESRR